MKCPKCDVSLSSSDRQGIEIDFCPECRGVWLDRGELDKIIERAARYDDQGRDDRPRGDVRHDRRDDYGDRGHYRKRKSIWTELFD